MIYDRNVYERALTVHAKYEARRDQLSPREIRRMQDIRDEILIWEWAHDNSPAVPVLADEPPRPLLEPPPVVTRFLAWWERNKWREPWVVHGWRAALWHWMDRPEEIEPEIWDAAESVFADYPGMVITDLAEWNRRMA